VRGASNLLLCLSHFCVPALLRKLLADCVRFQSPMATVARYGERRRRGIGFVPESRLFVSSSTHKQTRVPGRLLEFHSPRRLMKYSPELRIPHASKAVCLLLSLSRFARLRRGREFLSLRERYMFRTSLRLRASDSLRYPQHLRIPHASKAVCLLLSLSRFARLRRGRDSNPRGSFPPTRVPGERLRPLSHLSVIIFNLCCPASCARHRTTIPCKGRLE
jgi:hypothetical protein